MSRNFTSQWCGAAVCTVLLTLALGTTAGADSFFENFDAATGTGGGIFLDGRGFSDLEDWDDGLLGESAFGSASGHANAILSAQGAPGQGVSGGAGELSILDVNYDFINENFDSATGTGAAVFVVGDGVTPDVSGWTGGWDDGIGDESAFFGAFDGAIVVGDVTAAGVPGGAEAGYGQLIVNDVDVTSGGWYAGMSWSVPGLPAGSAPVLLNGGFDADANPPNDPGFSPQNWSIAGDGGFGWSNNIWLEPAGDGTQAPPLSGINSLKMWTAWFSGFPNETIVYQDMVAVEGQTWEIDCWTYHNDTDLLGGENGGNRGEMRIEFYNASDVLLDSAVATVVDQSSPTDVWIDNTPLQLGPAPAGTAYARAIVAYVDPTTTGGSGAAFWDDVTFEVVAGPPAFDLGAFSLTAEVRGSANTGAGEQLGHYQLRLEDDKGARLVFTSAAVADPNVWTPIGDTLDLAEERDANDAPAVGVFNLAADSFTVTAAFDNNRATTWGTGGTLEVDNIVMPSSIETGGYVAGLFWDRIPSDGEADPRNLELTADLFGDVAGGDYQLRVEVFADIPFVDEHFATLTGVGGDQLKAPGDADGYVETTDYDTGIEYEFGFAGTFEGAVVTSPNGGVWVEGDLTENAAKIRAREIAVGGVAGWYAGIGWRSQALASTNPASVNLSARIKGLADGGLLEQLGTVQLRIEDPDLDYIGFEQMATTGWQPIGGPLSGANASGALGDGDGVFDWNADSYSVVVVFEGTDANWGWGGTLWVDDVAITEPANPVNFQRGQISFSGSADGATYQTVGGSLIDGQSSFPGVGGVFDGGTGNWDRGIDDEEAFAGGYQAGIGLATAQGCADCGFGGTGGGQFIANGIWIDPAGTYWGGLAWHDLDLDMTDPNRVRFTADVKGEWDTSGGTVPGIVVIRIEDDRPADTRGHFGFEIPADGAWHHAGGTMNTAIDFNGFNLSTTLVHVVMIIYTNDENEGPNATITLDNLRVEYNDPGLGWIDVLNEDFDTVTGPTPGFLDDAGPFDTLTLVATMENCPTTWPDGGSLLIDNLSFGAPQMFEIGDLNCDGAVNFGDIDPFVLAITDSVGYAATYPDCDINLADINQDGSVNFGDIDPFVALITGG